ncbi:hypothetical protein RhiirB3_445095 [Rhizophagus irregularis]|nr:hypothetical protein RhiirB3_445095 [Rhizophagus irregularis]
MEPNLLTEDNILLNLLVDAVANIPLNNTEFSRLSITSLKYLLFITSEKETPFATREALVERLPTLKQIDLEQIENSIESGNKLFIDHQKVTKELEPLVKFINLKRIKTKILADIIEPLEIIPIEIICIAYRHFALLNNGKIVQAPINCNSHQNVRAKIVLGDKGIFEWDIIIERTCEYACVGVCASKNFNYESLCKISTQWMVNGTKYREVPEWYILPSKLYPAVSLCYPGRFRIQSHQKN